MLRVNRAEPSFVVATSVLQAIGISARAAIYDPTVPFANARISAKIAAVARPGVLFTFGVRYALADGETYAEETLPVFVTEDARLRTTLEQDHILFEAPELGGTPPSGVVERLRETVFLSRREEAMRVAVARAANRAAYFSTQEAERATRLSDDVERWAVAKRAWLERQLAPANREMALVIDEESAAATREEEEAYRRQRRRFTQELETLDLARRDRLEAITQRRHILAPRQAELIGALFVIPPVQPQAPR